jgi:hypothetical protein
MKAAIVIDDWKLPIFYQHLTRAGYDYKKGPGVTKGTFALIVETNDMAPLATVVRAANAEAASATSVKTRMTH